MTYASVIFAHRPHSSYKSFQVLQNKFMRMTTDSPWFVHNVDLNRDLDLPTIAQYMKLLSKTYFEKAVRHPNPRGRGGRGVHLHPRPRRRAKAATSEACP
ncbi:jg3411 [Pararge aegeria aegeria]|uniref:Jg3411 protein n=1 Tax=Pararge aegeria aegeria TaxID=348720 RepID=A0A8S4RQT4_9NEOP|nr:jg3411 [Pararge aegeria aegeria]